MDALAQILTCPEVLLHSLFLVLYESAIAYKMNATNLCTRMLTSLCLLVCAIVKVVH